MPDTAQAFPRKGFIDSPAFPGQRMAYPLDNGNYLSVIGSGPQAGQFRPGGASAVGASESFIMDGGRAYVDTGGPEGYWSIVVVG